eukprot:1772151-Alexandrium_andersonii.AAC.1
MTGAVPRGPTLAGAPSDQRWLPKTRRRCRGPDHEMLASMGSPDMGPGDTAAELPCRPPGR